MRMRSHFNIGLAFDLEVYARMHWNWMKIALIVSGRAAILFRLHAYL